MSKDIIDQINDKLPISLRHIDSIIQRVSDKYPSLSKEQIVIIVMTFFKCLREILIAGDMITISNLFSRMNIISFTKIRKGKKYRTTKTQLTTSKKIKYE